MLFIIVSLCIPFSNVHADTVSETALRSPIYIYVPQNIATKIPLQYKKLFYITAVQENVPISVLAYIAYRESNFNPYAKSKNRFGTYDEGMFQLNRHFYNDFERYYASYNPYDVEHSIVVAARHLNYLYSKLHSWDKVILAWNCGLTAVRKNKIPNSTKDYLKGYYSFITN